MPTVRVPLLDLKPQYQALEGELTAALAAVIESQRFIMGEPVAEFERAMAGFCGVPHAIACASGTDALLLSVKALNLDPGDEVITTPFTFFATAGAVVNAGGTPRFVDITPDTLNIDPALAADAVGARTRAIIPVHLFGHLAPMPPLLALAEAHGLAMIEDAAQAIGARQQVDGRWLEAGASGLTGAFSFFPSKNLGAWGDGGMVVTRDDAVAESIRLLRTHGGAKRYHHDVVGTNSRLDTLQAAILLVKLGQLPEWNRRRREHAAWYSEALAAVDGVRPLAVQAGHEPVFHQYTVRAERRDDLKRFLDERGIGSAVYYPKALHLQPCFADLGYQEGQFPVAEAATRDVLSLPIYPELPEAHREAVVAAIREFYG